MAARQKILIVDDDENISELISLYLTKEFYDTKIVHDGEEALRQFRLFSPNLILLDLMLPGIDGTELLGRMRASTSLRRIPVIMATAKGAEYDRVRALDGGADGLDFYRLLTEKYRDAVRPGGWLVLEIGYAQGPAVLALGAACGWVNTSCRKDYGGNDRAVLLQKPEKSC